MSIKRIQLDAMHMRSALQEHVGRWSMKELPMLLVEGDIVEFRYFEQHLDSGVITRVVTPNADSTPDWTSPNKAWWHIEYERHAFEFQIENFPAVKKMAEWEDLVHYVQKSSNILRIKFPTKEHAHGFIAKYDIASGWKILELTSHWEPTV